MNLGPVEASQSFTLWCKENDSHLTSLSSSSSSNFPFLAIGGGDESSAELSSEESSAAGVSNTTATRNNIERHTIPPSGVGHDCQWLRGELKVGSGLESQCVDLLVQQSVMRDTQALRDLISTVPQQAPACILLSTKRRLI